MSHKIPYNIAEVVQLQSQCNISEQGLVRCTNHIRAWSSILRKIPGVTINSTTMPYVVPEVNVIDQHLRFRKRMRFMSKFESSNPSIIFEQTVTCPLCVA